ncbi:hypothetical protein DSM100688_0371 [Bifidobacterium ramosum]|uniref:Uncharacterized protein n=1 Tax=Bifidobacterium ramosum TaxID=1798158 RepID=A0A6L4X2R1_9BIFI|nr:hypothetical protein DSM100688_0371 [Bifidobacterium ramosum]
MAVTLYSAQSAPGITPDKTTRISQTSTTNDKEA